MSSPYRRNASFSFGGPLTPGVKAIIIANMTAFLLQIIVKPFSSWLWLSPPFVLPWSFEIWRVGTYMFLHGGLTHLFFNMLMLFMFGCSIEREWGTLSFYRYYFICGLGAALFSFVPYGPFYEIPILGASGAIYGILLAYGVLFPYRQILIFLTFPVEARYLVAVLGFIAFAMSVASPTDGVAHTTHLGGFITGYVLLRWMGVARRRRAVVGGSDLIGGVKGAFRRWRMKRLRKKFNSYYEKRSGGNDPPPVH